MVLNCNGVIVSWLWGCSHFVDALKYTCSHLVEKKLMAENVKSFIFVV